jgi:spore coat protein U-like protein
MRNTTQPSEYLPYILDLDPASGTISFLGGWFGQTLKITGTVRANDYQKAYVGNYRDTVRITIVP